MQPLHLIYTVSKSKNKESPKVKEEVKDEVISPEEAGTPAVFLCLVSSWNSPLLCNSKHHTSSWLHILHISLLNNFLNFKTILIFPYLKFSFVSFMY